MECIINELPHQLRVYFITKLKWHYPLPLQQQTKMGMRNKKPKPLSIEERIMNAINRTDAVSVIIRGVEYSKEKYRFEIIDGDLFIIEK
jgi:hypothetical protein